ncbi:KH domain-containing protein [Baekduia soli]|uniref:KH domain-containing protein n=1 Tax=Baekduia soli TaxID=496014 RepID=A0A5B8U1H7_9ACTN|nr:R3H domain-containing nucleic acid-binding protein [Baekduia soli]QEC46792.1 KH domain-containing protein [Baekduia soli]
MPERSQEERLQELLGHIAEGLGLEATVEVTSDDDGLVGTLHGEDLGIFIGRHGQTIDAVQHLAQRVLFADPTVERRRVVVDAEGYRARRRDALEKQADVAADDAIQYGRPVALDAMTASERKHVHEYLRERGGVDTHSEGDEPERHLVVTPLP